MKVSKRESTTGADVMLPAHFAKPGNMSPQRLLLHAGAWRRDLRVELSEELADGEIGLSPRLLEALGLPEDVDYEVRQQERNLHIGPVIALVAAKKTERLTPEFLEARCKAYMARQELVGGLVYVCAGDSFDLETQTVRGWYLRADGTWQAGVFPYPGAVYNRSILPGQTARSLVAAIGDRLFNSYYFDKWEMYQWLQGMIPFPHTVRLDTVETLDHMLDLHGSVYLKQVNGSMGKGLQTVERAETGYRVQLRGGRVKVLDSGEMVRWIEELLADHRYCVQQSVSVLPYEGRRYDFRLILQKGAGGRWRCTGNIARFGRAGNIGTQFMVHGFARHGVEALQMAFGMSEREAFVKEEEMVRLCVAACEQLDRNAGNYGDVGIDLIVDAQRKVWMLEINKLHDHRMPLYALDDERMYLTVATTPLLYAKKLTGF